MNVNISDCFHIREDMPNQYTVKPGDNLYKIAKQFKISVNDLMAANDLTNTVIYPNQVLIISKTVPNGGMYFVEYVVKPQDTLAKISEATGIPTEIIGRYNDVTKLVLDENQVLQIPKSLNTYVIEEGDTIKTILNKTKMTMGEFLDLNLNNLLVPGMTIMYR